MSLADESRRAEEAAIEHFGFALPLSDAQRCDVVAYRDGWLARAGIARRQERKTFVQAAVSAIESKR